MIKMSWKLSVFVLGIDLLVGSTPALAQVPSPLPSTWQSEPVQSLAYARYMRHEADGGESTLIAMKQVCTCTPAEEVALTEAALQKMPSAVVQVNSSTTVCGEPAETMLITGVANAATGMLNLQISFFRRGDTLYSLEYTFSYPSPMQDAEEALQALCPAG